VNVGYPTLEGASIPGDPEGLRAIANRLQSARADVSAVQGRVAANGLDGWSGQASDQFRSALNKLPGELGTVAGGFGAVSDAISGFAGQLAGFQENASHYATRIRSLEEDLAEAQQRHDEAQSQVDAARLRESAASDPVSLKAAADAVRYGLSLLNRAIDDLDAHSQELARIRREAQNNREDYEGAVRTCCTELQDATESTARHSGAPHIAVMSMLGGLAMLLEQHRRGLEQVADGAENAYDDLDSLDELVEQLPVSMLGGWARPIMGVATDPVFEDANKVFIPLAVYGDFEDLKTTFDETRGENVLGRAFTTAGTLGGDAALFYPLVGAANFFDGGALSASMHGGALIGGAAISGGIDGAEKAYETDVRSGNYLAVPGDVLDGAASGAAHSALQADDQFAKYAESGQYNGLIKEFAKGEDAVIEHAAPAVISAAHGSVDVAKGLYHDGAHLLSDL
jgi:hypothetical protein